VRTCPSCGEQWATTVPVCTCGTNLARGDGQRRRWRPSRGLLMVVLIAVAVVPGAIAMTLYLLSNGTPAPGGVDVPDRGREARLDELPDRRARPNVTCEGPGVTEDCMVWTFTLPRSSGFNVAMAQSDDAVLVRDARNVWLVDLASGDERWHREQPDAGDGIQDVWLIDGHAILAGTTGFEVLDAASGVSIGTQRLDGRLIRVGADDARVLTATTWDDAVIVSAWDPRSAEGLWSTAIELDHPVLDMHLSWDRSAGLVPDEVLVVSITTRVSSDEVGHHRVLLDRETGDRREELSEPDPWDGSLEFDGVWVTLDGTQLRGERPPDTVVWERTLASPFVLVRNLLDNRAVLMPQDFTRITVIDASTGDDLFHIHGNNSRLGELPLQPPWVISVRTADAQHLVRLDLPSP
jgi:hypothetical protein